MPAYMVLDKVTQTLRGEMGEYMQALNLSPADMCIILEQVLSSMKELKISQYETMYHELLMRGENDGKI